MREGCDRGVKKEGKKEEREKGRKGVTVAPDLLVRGS